MLTKNKKLAYSVILSALIIAFLLTNERACLREMLVAQEIYYRGEYLITTYYPAPYAQYQDLVVMGRIGIGTIGPDQGSSSYPWSKLHIYGQRGDVQQVAPSTQFNVEEKEAPVSIGIV